MEREQTGRRPTVNRCEGIRRCTKSREQGRKPASAFIEIVVWMRLMRGQNKWISRVNGMWVAQC